jgi:hypothetical protein
MLYVHIFFFLLRARVADIFCVHCTRWILMCLIYFLSLLISLIMVYCFLIVHQVFNFVEPVNATDPYWQQWNGNAHTSGHFCFRYDTAKAVVYIVFFFFYTLKIRYTAISYTTKSFGSKSVNHGEWLPSSIILFWHCQNLNWQFPIKP